MGEVVHVCPGSNLGGNVKVGARSWVGIGSAVKQGVSLGADVTVGAGAVVISDIPDRSVVVGVPAKQIVRRC